MEKVIREKITVYYSTEFMGSIAKVEGYLIEHGRRKYAQYDDAPFVKFTPRKKRKPICILKGYKPYLLILKGWDNVDTQGLYSEGRTEGNVTIREGRYASFDDRFKTDFDAKINNYKHLFLADYRAELAKV